MIEDKKLEQFLNGELDVNTIDNSNLNKSEFIELYKILITKSAEDQAPDFDPFEKITSFRNKKTLRLKRLIYYAASVLILAGILSPIIYTTTRKRADTSVINEKQLAVLQEQTKDALLFFSYNLNKSLSKLEDIKLLSKPYEKIQNIKNTKIILNNPIKNKTIYHEN